MTDRWIGLCEPKDQTRLRGLLQVVDAGGRIEFCQSATAMRSRLLASSGQMGALVAEVPDDVPQANVVAALARDGMAREIVAAIKDVTPGGERLMKRAGATRVLDMAVAPPDVAGDLEEPVLPADETPTMIGHVDSRSGRDVYESVIPVIREGAHGPELILPSAQVHMPGPKTEQAAILTVVSGRGGVGKTSLVAAMAAIAAGWGMRVAAIDLDLMFGNLYSCFGLPGPVDLGRLAQGGRLDADAIMECGREVLERVTVWGPCAQPEFSESLTPAIDQLIATAACQSDVVLVDTSTFVTDAVAQAAQRSDRLVVVVDGLPGSAAAQARVGALAVRLGIARTRMVRLANRCGHRGRVEPEINRAEVGLETARNLRVAEGGREVRDFLAEGNVGDLLALGTRFGESLGTALAQLLVELGRLPDTPETRRALEARTERSRWSFGRRREAM